MIHFCIVQFSGNTLDRELRSSVSFYILPRKKFFVKNFF